MKRKTDEAKKPSQPKNTHETKKPEPQQSEIKRPVMIARDQKSVYAFIDASNLFWGGKESIGFKINYKKLLEYLEREHGVSKAFYYSGLRIFDFDYSILDYEAMDFAKLTEHLKELQKNSDEKTQFLIEKSLNKINFYQLLESYGYVMKIKPAKVYYDEDDENQERPILKANCDVDMTFDMMRYMQQYSGIIAMTGDGDFASVLNYLKTHGREVTVLSRWQRTAKEIKNIAEKKFIDLENLRHIIRLG